MIEMLAPVKVKTFRRHWTQAEFHELPEGPPYYELEDGELIEMARPQIRHQKIALKLGSVVSNHVEATRLGEIWLEIEVDITPIRTYVPDLTYLAAEHMGRIEEGQRIVGPPDLVVEISSPSTAGRDQTIKLESYQAAGVPWYWYIDADSLAIQELKNTADGFLVEQTAAPGSAFSPGLFPGLSFNLAELMGETMAKPETNDQRPTTEEI